MKKTELTNRVALKLCISKKMAWKIVDTVFDEVMAGVKKEWEVRIQGFGTFKKSKRAARTGVNPKNPSQIIKIPATNTVSFKAGTEFKSIVK